MWMLSLYAQRITYASELELAGLSLLCSILMMFPKLRSGLLRRRLVVNTWMRDDHPLRALLQGGSIYASIKLLLVFPLATLIIAELQIIHRLEWLCLIGTATLASLLRLWIYRVLKRGFYLTPSWILAREWSTSIFLGLSILILLPLSLYLPRPDLTGLSLQQALTQSYPTTTETSLGLFGMIQGLSSVKEVSFWWTLLNLPELLKGAPSWLISASMLGIGGLYALYSISVVYAFSRFTAGLLELGDPSFYRFMRSHKANRQVTDSTS
jgi:hypothetical protein